jgi:Leucine-rich repeat (LRR) protein
VQLEALTLHSKTLTDLAVLKNFMHVSALKSLELDCPSLKEMPAEFGHLSSLEELKLWHCDKLTVLPESLGELLSLKKLTIEANGLEKLPDNLGCLSSLEFLWLCDCHKLIALPERFEPL